jgi:hypothetical protein
MQSLSPAIQRIACDEPAHGRPQSRRPVLDLPEQGAVVLLLANPNIGPPRRLLLRGVPVSASFEVCPDKADLLDSLVASGVLYILSYRLSV